MLAKTLNVFENLEEKIISGRKLNLDKHLEEDGTIESIKLFEQVANQEYLVSNNFKLILFQDYPDSETRYLLSYVKESNFKDISIFAYYKPGRHMNILSNLTFLIPSKYESDPILFYLFQNN